MSDFLVYSVPGSPYGRAVLATLEEKQAPYRLSPLVPGTLQTEPHVSRHPFGKVPVLEHEGFLVYETQAILRYLDRVLPAPALTPADARAAARMDQVLNINDCYLFQGAANVICFHRIVGPRLLGLSPDEAAIAAATPKAHKVAAELNRLLGDRPYFTGDTVSLADILTAAHLAFLRQTPEWVPLAEGAPNLVAWLGRMEGRASFEATTWERVAEMAKAA